MENPIQDILQLYEYSMSIGKTLDYKQNCDQFLKLLLKRINFNACWIIQKRDDVYTSRYSIPSGKSISADDTTPIQQVFTQVDSHRLFPYSEKFDELCPIKIDQGELLIYNLMEEGFLFLYSKEKCFDERLTCQLLPVIEKFSRSLIASNVFTNQQLLLEQLQESNQELNNYAHVVSHDLKSPIRNIETLVSWLEEEFGEQSQTSDLNYFTKIRENISKMEGLISSILDYSSLSNKQNKEIDVSIKELVEEVCSHILIPDHIKIEIALNLPTIKAVRYRLQQLFQNLITNAVKYNDKSNGVVQVGYKEIEGYHQFFIRDNGIGIDAKYHQKIFEAFQKLSASKDSSGIGLSIVKRIVNSYKGEIWLESKPLVGTVFYFTLKQM